MSKKLCLVTLLLHSMFVLAFTENMCDCRYLFREQPSNSIMCNPYPNSMFVTRCVVAFSSLEGTPLRLDWYSKAHLTNEPEQIITGFTTDNSVSSSIGSELSIALTTDSADQYEGYRYFCRVKFANGTTFKDSQEVYLFPRMVVTDVLEYPDCDQGSIQSTKFEECIDPRFNQKPVSTTQEPTTQPPTTVPRPPTTQAPPTSPSSPPTTTTLPPTTNAPTTLAPLTPTTPSQPPPPPPTTSSPPPPPPPPSTTEQPTTARPPAVSNAELTFEEEILIYAAIAAAIALTLVVVLLLLCLCLWNRVCHQSKYCTCCS